jgi:hypothetical protein
VKETGSRRQTRVFTFKGAAQTEEYYFTHCRRLGASRHACPAPRLFVGTGQVQRRIISWELARGARDNLTMGKG